MSADKQEAAAAAPATPSLKGNTMLIVIIAVLGTLLLAGGIGVAFFVGSGSHDEKADVADAAEHADAAPAEAEEGKKADKSKDAKSKKDKKAPKLPAIYTPLEPPFVVNFPAGQGPRFLQVTVEVMTRDSWR
jgi:flagellar FliL protein